MHFLIWIAEAAAFALLGLALLRPAGEAARPDTQNQPLPHPRFSKRAAGAGLLVSQLVLALFLPTFYGLGQAELLRTLLMCSVLWPCAWADAQFCLIPNRVLLAGLAGALILLAGQILLDPSQAKWLLISAAVAAGALLLGTLLCRLISPKSVGMGDVKLLGLLGLTFGMDLTWSVLFFSLAVMFVYCVFLLATKRAKRSDSIPFAPFVLIGLLAAAILTGA